jgi:hypothetical protein
MHFHEYSQVRIRKWVRSPDASNDLMVYVRAPRVGDVGIVVSVYKRPDTAEGYRYTVECAECADGGGTPLWLGDFSAEELEAAPGEPSP